MAAANPVTPEHAADLAAAGDELFAAGQAALARACYLQAAELQPLDVRYQQAIGLCDLSLSQFDSAISYLQEATRLDPVTPIAHAALGQAYLQQGMVEQAMDASGRSMELAPASTKVIESRAWVLEAAGHLSAARDLAERLLARGYKESGVVLLFARLARGPEERSRALELVNEVLASNKIDAYERSRLHLAAASILDAEARYHEAFAHALRGNSLRKPHYEPAKDRAFFDRIIEFFSAERLAAFPKPRYRTDKPVFIVGMPRSGTTLVEQILASHPDVYGAGELDFIHRIHVGILQMLNVAPDEFPQCMSALSAEQLNGLADVYGEPLAFLAPTARRITDKFPLNFVFLGLIQVLLPEARVIHCRRNPLDTCLSCFMSSFGSGNEFKYALHDLGRFYRQYQRMMSHWRGVLTLPMLEVDYEEVVGDLETQARRMIDFIGLQWNDNCLSFAETDRPVSTASVQQIRRKLYDSSVGRWRNYEPYLGVLQAALADP